MQLENSSRWFPEVFPVYMPIVLITYILIFFHVYNLPLTFHSGPASPKYPACPRPLSCPILLIWKQLMKMKLTSSLSEA